MTPQEAIEILEMFLHKQCDLERTKFAYSENTIWIAVNMAKLALEKTVTKSVVLEGDGYDDKGELIYDIAYCPNCNHKFDLGYDEETNCCPNCGQALDWSDDK